MIITRRGMVLRWHSVCCERSSGHAACMVLCLQFASHEGPRFTATWDCSTVCRKLTVAQDEQLLASKISPFLVIKGLPGPVMSPSPHVNNPDAHEFAPHTLGTHTAHLTVYDACADGATEPADAHRVSGGVPATCVRMGG